MKNTGSANTITEVSFNVREPYGFRFLTQLRNAGDALFGSEIPIDNTTALRQTFILGIKFIGYDQNGNIMSPTRQMASDGVNNGQASYTALDPSSTDGYMFEHFIDITITECKFRIDGRMVTYNIKAMAKSQQDAFKISKGTNKQVNTITASSVGDGIDQLMTKLNNIQQSYANGNPRSIGIPTEYRVVWGPDTEDIWSANLVSPTDITKIKFPFPATNSQASNVSKEVRSQVADPSATTIEFANDQPIVKVITDIVKQSQFTASQLSILYDSTLQADPITQSYNVQKPAEQKKSLGWINITPQISNIRYDTTTRDFAYTITYFITKYNTPILDTPYVSGPKIYPGPHKRYDYWYTGKNTEVLNFEQTLDNTFIHVVQGVGDIVEANSIGYLGTNTENSNLPSPSVAPVAVGLNQTQPRSGRLGLGFNSQNSFLTALYDQASWLSSKITILGDPDFLPVEATYNEQIIYDEYYGVGSNKYTINASGGQVFIEIDFEEPVDYENDGLLSVNEQIAFVKYPDSVRDKIKGVSFQVISVDHNFSNGVFKQTLSLVGNTFGMEEQNKKIQEQVANQRIRNAKLVEQVNPPQPSDSNATGTTTGTTQDKPVTTTPTSTTQRAVVPAGSPQEQKSNNVANDDARG